MRLCTFLSDSFPVVKNGAMLTLHCRYESVKHILTNPNFYCRHVHFCMISSGFINTRLAGCRTMKMSVSFPSKEKQKQTLPLWKPAVDSAVLCWNVKCFVALDFSDTLGTESGRNWQKWMRMSWGRMVLSRNRRHTAKISTSLIMSFDGYS